MKKKELSFRHQVVAEMPLDLLLGLIEVNALDKFVNNTVEEHDINFLNTYIRFKDRLKEDNTSPPNKLQLFFTTAFIFNNFEGDSYWWRKYWEMVR